jgi:hypothetical protein
MTPACSGRKLLALSASSSSHSRVGISYLIGVLVWVSWGQPDSSASPRLPGAEAEGVVEGDIWIYYRRENRLQ